MSENTPRLYEGLFLFGHAAVDSSITKAVQLVRDLITRHGGEPVSISKWDDRKLAYEIEGLKRGLFILAYFNVKGSVITDMERDVQLSEQFTRCLIIRADHIGEAELELAKQAQSQTMDEAAIVSAGESAAAPVAAAAGPVGDDADVDADASED
jgi:small subunit ribosomal protein S6